MRIAAIGDLMLSGEWEDMAQRGLLSDAFGALRCQLGREDSVFANLETAVEGNAGYIDKQPRVIASENTVKQALRTLRINVVNLANNHAFDSHPDGFRKTRALLDQEGICHFGAGESTDEAARPSTLEHNGVRVGWLGYVDLSTRPSHVARRDRAGVLPLVEENALAAVKDLKQRVDHVIVSLHWGVEYCHLPSPAQVQMARSLVDMGASAVIGHHVHVVQGLERWRNGVIAYSLGNATTADHFIDSRRAIRQTARTRSSYILRLVLSKHSVEEVQTVPIRSHKGRVLVNDHRAHEYLQRANRYLDGGISEARWRRRRVFEDVFLRAGRKLHPSVVFSLRPYHFVKIFKNLDRALRGSGPA